MLIHDVIKIRLVESGYLPDYPYHLISDDEMCDAFIDTSNCEFDETESGQIINNQVNWIGDRNTDRMFDDRYPLIVNDEGLSTAYNNLINSICFYIMQFKENYISELPNWVYSYMLGSTISPMSEVIDIEDLYRLTSLPVRDVFNKDLYELCLTISTNQLRRIGSVSLRNPTIFGEPHVIKELRTHGGLY